MKKPTVMTPPSRYIPELVCPACLQAWLRLDADAKPGAAAGNSRSRYTEHYICSACGAKEAFEGFFWLSNALKFGIPLNDAGQVQFQASAGQARSS